MTELPSREQMAEEFISGWEQLVTTAGKKKAVAVLLHRRDEMVVEACAKVCEIECAKPVLQECHDSDARRIRALKEQLK